MITLGLNRFLLNNNDLFSQQIIYGQRYLCLLRHIVTDCCRRIKRIRITVIQMQGDRKPGNHFLVFFNEPGITGQNLKMSFAYTGTRIKSKRGI